MAEALSADLPLLCCVFVCRALFTTLALLRCTAPQNYEWSKPPHLANWHEELKITVNGKDCGPEHCKISQVVFMQYVYAVGCVSGQAVSE
jgi:hypothetical protein